MLIVAEGSPHSGVTTFARDLAGITEQLNAITTIATATATRILVPDSDTTHHSLAEYEQPIDELIALALSEAHCLICDRWHLKEALDPGCGHSHEPWEPSEWLHMRLFLTARGATQVILRDKGEIPLPISAWPPTHWRTLESHPSLSAERDILIKAAATARLAAPLMNDFPHYIGSLSPYILIVTAEEDEEQLWPNPATGTMMHWLLSGLSQVPRHKESCYGLINTLPHTNTPAMDIETLWMALSRPRLVALGTAAGRELTARGLPHVSAPHPRFMFTHHPSELAAYAHELVRSVLPFNTPLDTSQLFKGSV